VTTRDNYYWYDGLQQVTQHDRGNLTSVSGLPPYTGIDPGTRQLQEDFTYDETGNWAAYQSTSPSLAQTRTHNKGNRITSLANPSGVVQPVYDAQGRMTTMPRPGSWTGAYTCKWDAWSRLVEVSSGGVPVAKYSYDALTRRIRTATGYYATEEMHFYFDRNWRTVEERRPGGSPNKDYVYNPRDRWNLIRRPRSLNQLL